MQSNDNEAFKSLSVPILDSILQLIIVLSYLDEPIKRLQLIEIRKGLKVVDDICAKLTEE
jgi:hypothetical protein